VHRLVQDRLREYAAQVREFGYALHAPAFAADARLSATEDAPRRRF
jgi:hypothetical protein